MQEDEKKVNRAAQALMGDWLPHVKNPENILTGGTSIEKDAVKKAIMCFEAILGRKPELPSVNVEDWHPSPRVLD